MKITKHISFIVFLEFLTLFSVNTALAAIDITVFLNKGGLFYFYEEPSQIKYFKNDDIVYKIEIKRSTKKLELKPTSFNGLKNIEEHYENGIYIYTYGSSKEISYAENVLLKHVENYGI